MPSLVDALDVELTDQDKADLKIALGEERVSSDKVKSLYQKRGKVWDKMLELQTHVSKEDWTSTNQEQFDKMDRDVIMFDKAIDHQEKLFKLDALDIEMKEKQLDYKKSKVNVSLAEQEKKNAFNLWLRGGMSILDNKQQG